MQPTQFTDAVEAISSEHQGYDSGAYYFLKDTLDFTVRRVMESNDGKHYLMSAQVLRSWVHPAYWNDKHFVPSSPSIPALLSFLGASRFAYVR